MLFGISDISITLFNCSFSICVIYKYNPLNTSNTKIIELQKEIVELLKKTKFFERGYIIDDAIENGWLKYDENTTNTMGAYIYK